MLWTLLPLVLLSITTIHGNDETRIPVHAQPPSVFFPGEAEQQLCLAIQCGDVSWMQSLLAAGADPEAVGRYGMTPLTWSYLHLQQSSFKFLLSLGCDVTVPLALPPELWPDRHQMVYREGDPILLFVARDIRTTWWLVTALQLRDGINCTNPRTGANVLHAFMSPSIENGWRPDVAQEFVKAGINLNALDIRGDSVAIRALDNRWYDAVLWFLENGTSPDTYNSEHLQLIHHVAMEYRTIHRMLKVQPETQQEWEASDRKRAWEKLLKHLRDRGYSLTEALIDLERREQLVEDLPFMVWRRLQRDDRYCGENGQQFRDYVKRRFPEDHPYATWVPPGERK